MARLHAWRVDRLASVLLASRHISIRTRSRFMKHSLNQWPMGFTFADPFEQITRMSLMGKIADDYSNVRLGVWDVCTRTCAGIVTILHKSYMIACIYTRSWPNVVPHPIHNTYQ